MLWACLNRMRYGHVTGEAGRREGTAVPQPYSGFRMMTYGPRSPWAANPAASYIRTVP